MSVMISALFIMIVMQFYKLQIIEHETYKEAVVAGIQREVEVPALRGAIYDRYGHPLATNQSIYVLKIDPQVRFAEENKLNHVILNVITLLERNGDDYIDSMPISKEAPFTFTKDEQSVRSFITNYVPYNDQAHKEKLYRYSAQELIDYLRGEDVFSLEEAFSDNEVRKIIAVRLEMRQTMYQKYKKVTIANEISMKTIAAIEENQAQYPGIVVELETKRYYTYGKAFGNILGYTRKITKSQYEKLKESGYDETDLVGQVGIEASMESELRGEKGHQIIEVDNVGRTVFTTDIKEAVKGNDIYLTIDAELQLAVYEAIEKNLSKAIVERLRGGGRNIIPLTGREVLNSMATNNQLDFKKMEMADQKTMQKQLYDKIESSYKIALKEGEEEQQDLTIKQHFAQMLEDETERITSRELLLAMAEQGSLKLEEDQIKRIWKGDYGSLEALVIAELESGDLKAEQMAIKPFSGSAVVVDVNSGEVLALVSYPSFDSNEFTQNFNEIYTKLYDGVDSRNMEINRALKTARAPGSPFKMLVAIAGMEEGVITPHTIMNDVGFYTNAGKPYPRCWHYTNNGYGHGNVDVKRALEVSCNYFFYDIPYRLGLKYGAPYGAIDVLTNYVEQFGLAQKTGIELEETLPNVSNPQHEVYNQVIKALNGLRNMNQDKKEHFKEAVRAKLSQVLGGADEVIFNKIMEDFKEGLAEDLTEPARQVVREVFNEDEEVSLKVRSKKALVNLLMDYIESGTRRTVVKTMNELFKIEDEKVVDQILMQMIEVYVDDFFEKVDMEWTMAINVRTAIGQGKNAFTPVQMARYIAGLANGKEVYDLKVVNGIYDHKETNRYYNTPVKLFNTLHIKASTLKSVYEGMRAVVHGQEGSARTSFSDFQMQVAGKTGTAEGGRYEDSWFVGFAPYENPEIAIVTSMYEADGLGNYNIQLARDVFEIYFNLNHKETNYRIMGNAFIE